MNLDPFLRFTDTMLPGDILKSHVVVLFPFGWSLDGSTFPCLSPSPLARHVDDKNNEAVGLGGRKAVENFEDTVSTSTVASMKPS